MISSDLLFQHGEVSDEIAHHQRGKGYHCWNQVDNHPMDAYYFLHLIINHDPPSNYQPVPPKTHKITVSLARLSPNGLEEKTAGYLRFIS